MADNGGEGDFSTAAVEIRSHHSDLVYGVDFISSLPDTILQHILSFLMTKYAIRTSVLSKRWKHIWSESPSLHIIADPTTAESINKTLTSYRAPKITCFNLYAISFETIFYVDRWIEFAMAKDTEILNLGLCINFLQNYSLPDAFYFNSSIKRLSVRFIFNTNMIIGCTVSWKSLRELCLMRCNLHDECIANIMSGCPMLESLVLIESDVFQYLDLSRSLHLRKLEIHRSPQATELRIVAPHIHYLEFINSHAPCTLVDVSSLAEANINLWRYPWETFTPKYIQNTVPKMLEKLQDVGKLTFGAIFLQILSVGGLFGVSFPMLKVKNLTLETMITRSIIPSVAMLLQKSPGLKKLTIHIKECDFIPDESLDKYLEWGGLNPNQFWRFIYGKCAISSLKDKTTEPKLVISFMEFLLRNANTLDTLVVRLGSFLDTPGFDELLQLSATLCHDGVLIVLK